MALTPTEIISIADKAAPINAHQVSQILDLSISKRFKPLESKIDELTKQVESLTAAIKSLQKSK
jgi:hypothetical protein